MTAKKATILNDQFIYVFSEPFQLSLEQLSKHAMNDALIQGAPDQSLQHHVGGVRKLLSGLNPNNVANQDKLQPWVRKELADVLTPIVVLIYNASKKLLFFGGIVETQRLQM